MKPTRKLSSKAPFKLAQDNVEPRGNKDSMDAAKQCLGPFVGGKFGSSPAEDEEYAEQKIFEIARSYNWHRLLNAQSPRSNVVKNSLDQVIESTAAAFRALRGMDDHTRLMFEFCASEPSTAGLHAEANGIALPLSSFDGRPDRESPWLLQLQGLHRLINWTVWSPVGDLPVSQHSITDPDLTAPAFRIRWLIRQTIFSSLLRLLR